MLLALAPVVYEAEAAASLVPPVRLTVYAQLALSAIVMVGLTASGVVSQREQLGTVSAGLEDGTVHSQRSLHGEVRA